MKPHIVLFCTLLTVSMSRAADALDAPGTAYRKVRSPIEFRDPIDGLPTIGDRTPELLKRLDEIEALLKKNEANLAKGEGTAQVAQPKASNLPADIFIHAYIGFQHAEKAIDRNDLASATWILTEVYRILSELQQQHPTWEPAIVEYRKQCVLNAMGKAPAGEPASKQAADSELKAGIAFYMAGKLDDAVTALARALSLDPKSARAHLYLSRVAAKQGWKEAAEKELAIAKTLDGTLNLEKEAGAPGDGKKPQ